MGGKMNIMIKTLEEYKTDYKNNYYCTEIIDGKLRMQLIVRNNKVTINKKPDKYKYPNASIRS